MERFRPRPSDQRPPSGGRVGPCGEKERGPNFFAAVGLVLARLPVSGRGFCTRRATFLKRFSR